MSDRWEDFCLAACKPCEKCGQHVPKRRPVALCEACGHGLPATLTPAVPVVQGDGGLRKSVAKAVAIETDEENWTTFDVADAVLALPVMRRLLADAAAGRAAQEAVERVRALHTPVDRGTGPQCEGCATSVTFTRWPCATVRALAGEV